MHNPFLSLFQAYLPEPESSLLSGMIFGAKQGFSREFYQALITTGTIHVVALSGTNITILINLLSKLTLPLGRKAGSIISIVGIIAFILFVGPSPSVVRAGLMGGLTLISIYLGRQSSALLSLILVAGIMLGIEPKLISNLSFQLSFLATLGILLFAPQAGYPPGERGLYSSLYFDIKQGMKENFRTTIAAQIMTLPVLVFAFGRVSLVAPLTNILIGWTITPLMFLGLGIAVIGTIYLPLGQILSWICYPLLWYFVKAVEMTSKIPWASVTIQ